LGLGFEEEQITAKCWNIGIEATTRAHSRAPKRFKIQ